MSTPYSRTLNNGLILKSIHDDTDIERIATFNQQIFGEGVATMSRELMHYHPAYHPDHWLYIEDPANGKIVSSLALITWQWRYDDVRLKSGEMAIVGTDEAYRKRGLIRALAERHQELLHMGDFDLSHIQGIPYFYRQFGYEYAIPLEPEWELELRKMPDMPNDSPYHFREASIDDIPELMRMFEAGTCQLDITNLREPDIWRFMLQHTAGTELEGEIWLMLDAKQQPIGYWRIGKYGFGTGLIVTETSRLNQPMAETLLGWLKAEAIKRDKPYVRFNLPITNDLLRAARYYGVDDITPYAWQMHLVDIAKLLMKLAPVFNRRLAASSLAGLTQTAILNLYREAFALKFEAGRLVAVKNIGFTEEGEIRMPPHVLTPLLLGYRNRHELRHMYPDVGIWGQGRQLVDVLFPKMDSFIFTNY